MESKIVKEIVEEYELKDGIEIDLSCLVTISKRKKIEIKDLFKILGIYRVDEYINMKKALTKKKYIIHIYTEEDYNKMEEEIKANFEKKTSITYFQFIRLQEKYKIATRKLQNILEITKDEYKRLNSREQRANICLEREKVSKEFLTIREELKYFDKITLHQLEEVKEKYLKSYKEMRLILKAESVAYSNFIHKRVKTLKVNLLSNQEKIELKEKIMQMCQQRDYITKREIKNIQKELKASNDMIKKILSINSQNFNALMSNKIQMTRIVFSGINRKAFLLKMDCIYYDSKKFHTKRELIKRTKQLGISLEEFIKNLHTNVKHYAYNLEALDNNKKGLYIGKEHPISNSYITRKQEVIKKIIDLKFWQYYTMFPFGYDKENIKAEVFFQIMQKGGILEKNFSYDDNLLISLLKNKAKYFIWNQFQKVRREYMYMNQYKYELVNICSIKDEKQRKLNKILELLQDKEYFSILMYVQQYEDIIQLNRQFGYELIAKKMQMKYESLMKVVEVVQEDILKSKVAKRGKNGTVIVMTEETIF